MAEAAWRLLRVTFALLMVAVLDPCQGELCAENHDVLTGPIPCQPCPDCPESFGWNSTQNSSLVTWLSPQSSSGLRFALLVPIFCLLGLAGVYLCESSTLKARGHQRSSGHKDVEAMEGLGGEMSANCEGHVTNEDTIGMLVRYFMRSKSNLAVLRALAREQDAKESGDTFISWTLQPSPCLNHAHTVHVWPDVPTSHSSHVHCYIPVTPLSASHVTQMHGAPYNQLANCQVLSVGRGAGSVRPHTGSVTPKGLAVSSSSGAEPVTLPRTQ
uniref:tumor necrosis factor receptor superfamily member 19L-like isoform X2 n=1 Tax=Myxine glutinosa TaxID=7769 RepID=UPI00358DE325